ncbi:hypothetical protein [Nocardia sp. NPDC005978]|uniref:hypothetical protein n=1 Tax=unclassified Nocardia TaxID=2637762 RepID=UPI0033BEF723
MRQLHSVPAPAADPEAPVHVMVRDVLDYFGSCERCGYPAQASEVVRTFGNGRVQVAMTPTCGLPCGWHGQPRVSHTTVDDLTELRTALRQHQVA